MVTPSNRTYTYCDTKLNTKCNTMTTQNSEPPRSTAYYYADLERFKKKTDQSEGFKSANQSERFKTNQSPPVNPDELSEYVEANDVINDGPIREVPPLRDRNIEFGNVTVRPDAPIGIFGVEHSRTIENDDYTREGFSPENIRQREQYSPENIKKGETYSTAGTFPMPETKEKEPLLAELEVVGRLPLTQLDGPGVRRSRSWYLCCPNVGEDDMSRQSSWRYSSLRPVTSPPVRGEDHPYIVASQSSARTDDVTTLKAERDTLARALTAERQRAASAARAHDARLAELHGVIAELVRRRAQDKQARAIPEEEGSDECESTTQPAGELAPEPTESQSPSILSPEHTPQDTQEATPIQIRVEGSPSFPRECEQCDTSLNLSERDSEICLSTGRCCQHSRGRGSGGSCDRERGSSDAPRLYTSPGRCESRQAKLASRVKLKRTEDTDSTAQPNQEEWWCHEAAEQLALDVCAQADLREALVAANNDGATLTALLAMSRARCQRLQADVAVLQCALSNATDTQHRLYCACSVLEQRCVALCAALRCADRALETYDVLLALAETQGKEERAAAELVARQLVSALEAEQAPPSGLGDPLLSRGPWLQHDHQTPVEEWSAECEARLRAHAARLKADTVSLRPAETPTMFSFHDTEDSETESAAVARMQDMEAAVCLQEVLESREAVAARSLSNTHTDTHTHTHPTQVDTHVAQKEHPEVHKSESGGGRRRARRHWLETQASETEL